MEENINNLPPETEAPPELAAEATQTELPQGTVDESPDPAKLKAEIEQLEAKRKKAEEDAIYWRKQKAEARAEYFRGGDRAQERTAPPPVEAPGIGPEPKPSDFPDYDQYVQALADHRASKKLAEWEITQARKRNEEQQQREMIDLRTKLNDGYAKYPDFGEVAFDPTAAHITPMVVDILKTCERPDETLYYLAKNRVEGVAISRMTPIKAAMEIAKIESRLASGSHAVPSAPSTQRKTTSAPPPINPLSGSTGGIQKDPDKMTFKEFEQWRISQGARRY